MKINDLWIGDLVRLKKSGRVGKFEGVHLSGKVRVRIDSKIILTKSTNLEKVDEAHLEKTVDRPKSYNERKMNQKRFQNSIDLHIEKLQPSLSNELPQMILNKQIAACRAYIEEAIELRRMQVTIIHGKGAGQLKLEVQMILQERPEVQYYDLINDGGATLVGFQYATSS